MTAERKQSLYCCELIPGQMKKDFYLGINIGLLKWNLLQKKGYNRGQEYTGRAQFFFMLTFHYN